MKSLAHARERAEEPRSSCPATFRPEIFCRIGSISYLCSMNRGKKRKEKFANWLLDIAKYITTAVIISSIFEGIENKAYLLITGIAVVGASLGWGMMLIQDDDTPKKKKG